MKFDTKIIYSTVDNDRYIATQTDASRDTTHVAIQVEGIWCYLDRNGVTELINNLVALRASLDTA